MIINTVHTYTNIRKDGKVFFHESEERARGAVNGNKKDYDSIAVHSKSDTRRCDICHEKQKINYGVYSELFKQDLCPEHLKELMNPSV